MPRQFHSPFSANAVSGAAGAICALAFSYALLPSVSDAFKTFHPFPMFYSLVGLGLGILLLPIYAPLLKIIAAIPNGAFDALAFFAAFAASLCVNLFVFEKIPRVSDSITYYFMAKTFASGSLYLPESRFPEFETYHFFINNDGKFYGVFPPGWPALLAFGMLAKAPHLVCPILSGALALVSVKIMRLLFSEPAARLTPLVFLLSPFFLFQGSEFMSHPMAALLTAIAVWQAILLVRRGDKKAKRLLRFGVIGASIGLLTLARPFDGLIACAGLAAFFAYLFYRNILAYRLQSEDDRVRAGSFKSLITGILICAAFIAFFTATLLAYNKVLTGGALLFPLDRYFEQTEQNKNCHRVGFGADIGCPGEHGLDVYPDGYNLANAVSTTKQRLSSLYTHFLPYPLLVIICALALLFRKSRRNAALLWAWFWLVALGYALFYYNGNCYGPRFLYGAYPALAGLAAVFLAGLSPHLAEGRAPKKIIDRIRLAVAFAIIFAAVGVGAETSFASLVKTYSRFRGVDRQLQQVAESYSLKNAAVLIPGNNLALGLGFYDNDPRFEGNVIYARSWGDQDYLYLIDKGREGWRYAAHAKELRPVKEELDPTRIKVEGESKVDNMRWCPECERPFSAILPADVSASDGRALYFEGKKPGDWFELKQWVFEEGYYDVYVDYYEIVFAGSFELYINGEKCGESDARGAEEGRIMRMKSDKVWLNKGFNRFRFVISGASDMIGEYGAGVDLIILDKTAQ